MCNPLKLYNEYHKSQIIIIIINDYEVLSRFDSVIYQTRIV